MPARRRASALSTSPDRTAGLDDWGPTPPPSAPVPATSPPPPVAPDELPDSVEDPPSPAQAVRKKTTRHPPARTTTPARTTRPISARIPVSLFAAVNEARAATGETHEMWFLAALDAVWDQLETEYPPARHGSRVPLRDRRARRPAGEPLVQYPLRLTDDERAALEDRYRTCRPSSMADLVTTIVRLGLAARSAS